MKKVVFYFTLHEKYLYQEFFWSVFNPNAEKYRPEKLQIWTIFMQCYLIMDSFLLYLQDLHILLSFDKAPGSNNILIFNFV